MTEGPFRPRAATNIDAEADADADVSAEFRRADSDLVSDAIDSVTDDAPATETDPFDTTDPDDVATASESLLDDAGASTDLSALVALMNESGIDTVWLDLDGDLVPDTQVSAAGPFVDPYGVDAIDAEAFDDPSGFDQPTGPGYSDGQEPMDPFAYETWITFPVHDGGSPIYDMSELAPIPGGDWTAPGVQGYDPMASGSFSISSGPVMFDAAGQQPYSPVDYTDPSLWYNSGSFESGAGYWDPAYVSAPAAVDPGGWAPVSGGYDPASFDQMSGGYDPMTTGQAGAGWDPMNPPPFTFDPANPLPTYTPYTSFDPSNPLPTSALPTGAGYSADAFAVPEAAGYSTPSTGWSPADMSSYAMPSGGSPTDVVTSYYTDPTFDNQLSEASANSNFWMDQYQEASTLQNDYWQASVDASVAGNDLLAYDLNQLSLQSGSVANDAWSYSSSAWDSVGTGSSTSTSSADDGWYDAMSLDS